jgi:antitoxin YefM
MRIASSTELRNNLSKYLDQVHDDHTPLVITRSGGKPHTVMLSLDDYNAQLEVINHRSKPTTGKM